MTDHDLIRRITALRQQIDDLTARLNTYVDQREDHPPGAETDLHLGGQICHVLTDIAALQADLRHTQPARPSTVRGRDLVLSVDARGLVGTRRSAQPSVS